MEGLDEKIKEIFPVESVFKDPEKSKFFANLNIPSYMRDWIVKKFSRNGELDVQWVREFIQNKIPRKEDAQILKERMINRKETIEILAKIIVEFDITTGEALMSLPELGLPDKKHQGRVEKYIIDKYGEEILSIEGAWGVVTLEWRLETPPGKKKEEGRIVCTDFKPFKPYNIDLDYFKEARKNFTTEEWIDLLIKSMDYNPEGFLDEKQKIRMISRLLPFVEKRVNIIELAPKGTGKTYVYSQLSKYGWLVSGGSITRAKLFYDKNRRKPGLVSRYDYVALDEVQSISFPDENEIRGALKGYLETGEYRVGDYKGIGEAGFVVLGNIPIEKQDENEILFDTLPAVFRESALIDRFHGFIKGWELPRIKEGMKAKGYALNVEYFSEVLHKLRDDLGYLAVVNRLISVPKDADSRDVEAIKRISTGFLKLLFPHVNSPFDIELDEFKKYCLSPAIEMRGIIRKQLNMIDKEYSKNLPNIKLVKNPE